MGCQADYDKDCKGKKPKGCMCLECCKTTRPLDFNYDIGNAPIRKFKKKVIDK